MFFPNARSAATQLAAMLLLDDQGAQRQSAYDILSAAYANPAQNDPLRQYLRGDARLFAAYMSALRQGLH